VQRTIKESEFLEYPRKKLNLPKSRKVISLTIKLEGKPIGFITIRKDKLKENVAVLTAFALRKKYRNKNIGALALYKLLKMMKKDYNVELAKMKIETENQQAIV